MSTKEASGSIKIDDNDDISYEDEEAMEVYTIAVSKHDDDTSDVFTIADGKRFDIWLFIRVFAHDCPI